VTPGVATPLEQVADRIRDDMAREAAGRLFDRTDETFYEMVQDSAKLDAISAEVGAPLITFSGLDAQGRIPAARQTTFLSGVPDLLDSAFRLSAGQTGDVVEFEVDNPYTSDPDDTRPVRAVLRVDAVEAGRQPALEEVRSDVLALYRDEKQREAAGKAVDEVLAAIAGGATLEKAAEGGRMAVVTAPQPFSRADQGALDPAIQEAVFKAAAGAPFRTDDSRGEPWIIRVDAVTPLSPDMEARIGQQLRQQVQQSLSFDVQEMFLKSLQQQIRMRRNEGAIQRFLDSFKPEAE
jgi:peptidyl-prolyl cis-trans isomerase D